MEEKTISLQRETLYKEIWQISLSKVAKKYGVDYQKLRAACINAKIPLPSNSYWGSFHMGKNPPKEELPPSEIDKITVQLSVSPFQIKAHTIQLSKEQPALYTERREPVVHTQQISGRNKNVYNRNTLYAEVWTEPVSKVAKRYNVSDVMLHKVCKSLNVPVPPRGYWAKKNAGQNVMQAKLPPDSDVTEIIGNRQENKAKEELEKEYHQSLDFLSDEEKKTLIDTAVSLQGASENQKLHPILQKHSEAFSDWAKKHPRDEYANWKRDYYHTAPKDQPALWECVTQKALPRLYYILNPLFYSIEKLGGRIASIELYEIRGERVLLSVTEGRTRASHVLTKQEQHEMEKYDRDKERYYYASKPQIRKYDYIPNGMLRISAYRDSFIRDTNKAGVELRTGEVLIALYMQSEDSKNERIAREEAQRKAEEETRLREQQREQYNQEVDNLEILLNKTNDYAIASRIREYITAVEKNAVLNDEDTMEWIAWAKAKADWYDPLVSAKDPIFGERDHGDDEKNKHPVKKRYWGY